MDMDKELQTLLSEQRHELKAAKALESDLDFAFQLQFQEAINASLSLHPHPSSSNTHLPNDAVPSPGLAHLLDQEIVKFELEYHDRQQAHTEMIKLQNDLNRRIHDQAFARELLNIPEKQWAKTGDYIHRPFGEGSSMGGGGESFGLYFKGLMSEQNVGGVTKVLGGIGVAICDGNDNLVFELCKPLMGGVEVNGEVADLKALIEALDSAITLGIKRVTVFCHDNSIYHYVTGKWIPRQGHITTMVDQVSLLQRKFTHCNPSLVALKDIKYAFKLAREAIVSQTTQPAKRARGKNLTETCVICLEDTDAGQMFSVNNCLHRYCISCMKQHVEAKLLQGILPKCPHEGCKSDMKIESCKKFLTSELFDIMSQRIKENSIPAADKIYCPYPKCSALMSKHEVQRCAINTFVAGQAGARKCIKCHGLFCINCKVPWHENLACYDYKRLNPYPCAEDAKLNNLARRNLWRQCVKCNHMVELTEGCYHIYCRCGYEFCYTCGAEWKNKKATCNCPIWDERNIVYDTNNRHQQRRG